MKRILISVLLATFLAAPATIAQNQDPQPPADWLTTYRTWGVVRVEPFDLDGDGVTDVATVFYSLNGPLPPATEGWLVVSGELLLVPPSDPSVRDESNRLPHWETLVYLKDGRFSTPAAIAVRDMQKGGATVMIPPDLIARSVTISSEFEEFQDHGVAQTKLWAVLLDQNGNAVLKIWAATLPFAIPKK